MGTPLLSLDASVCVGHAICALKAPEAVALDDWGYAHLVDDAPDTARAIRGARQAAAACPAGALTETGAAAARRRQL